MSKNDSLILLATYNGEAYIKECLNSFSDQCDIYISDDCSSDKTLQIISEYKNNAKCVCQVSTDIRRGSASRNFSFLINNCSTEYKYYFLSDQDDVWHKKKYEILINEMKLLEKQNTRQSPILIYGDSIVVDCNMKVMSNSFFCFDGISNSILSNPKNIFFQNVGQGATMVFNKEFLLKIRQLPYELYMHDWWLMLYARTFGIAYFSKEKTLFYRQHDRNNIGAKKRPIIKQIINQFYGSEKVKNQISNIKKQTNSFNLMYSKDFLDDSEIKTFLEEFKRVCGKNFFHRKWFLISNKIFLSNVKRTLVLYIYF